MKPVAPPTASHGTSSELIHNDRLAPTYDVVDVPLLKLLCLKGVDEVDSPLLPGVVQVLHLQNVLRNLVSLFRKQNALLLLVHLVVHVRGHSVSDLGALDVPLGGLFRLAADDQGSTRLVDKDAVHLIHNAEVEITQHQLLGGLCQVVTQVIETKLAVCNVGDVVVVRLSAVVLRHPLLHQANLKSEETVHLSHNLSVTARQVVVHRHHMHALAADSVQVRRETSHQCLSFTSPHLGDLALMEDHAPHELHVERSQPQHTARCLADHREHLRKERVERLALRHSRPELVCLCPQLLV
mmetsp:Transcript_32439/g.70838  ORF Transcript_32439/g.70838 Transcript_32439/m.70838 type:complete len:297 (-) Transcript_32439:426-1316(-)